MTLRLVSGLPSVITPYTMKSFYNFPDFNPLPADPRPKIGVISLGGYYRRDDLEHYWTNYCHVGASVRPTVTDRVVGYHGLPLFDRADVACIENTLDLELIGGLCTNADIYFYSALNTFEGYYDAFKQAIDDGMQAVSTSWGSSEDSFYGLSNLLSRYDTLFQQAVAQGTIITAATGDSGSSGNDFTLYTVPAYPVKVPVPHAGFPSSSPHVVACGGTSLYYDTLDPASVDEETAWFYGGGGQSSRFMRPDYQGSWQSRWPVSPICYKSGGQPFARTTPDVVFNADPNSPWTIWYDGEESDQGAGTSATAPLMAALLGIYYVLSQPYAAPRQGYFGMGFNYYLYRSPVGTLRNISIGNNVTVQRQPITNLPNPYGQISDEQHTYYSIYDPVYSFCAGRGVVVGDQMLTYLNTIVCVPRGSMVCLADGRTVPIEEVQRGDRVRGKQGPSVCPLGDAGTGDIGDEVSFKVAYVNQQVVAPTTTLDIVEIKAGSLGPGQPECTTWLTANHPIFYRGARRPAKCFQYLPGVTLHQGVQARSVLPRDPVFQREEVYVLYDLQFEEDGSYWCQGLRLQSRSPWSEITPLPRELYFDVSRYREERHWDSLCQGWPLDDRELMP